MEGLSRTTLAHAREMLAHQFYPGDASGDQFRKDVNMVMERFYEKGGWRGSEATYLLTVASNKVTLPYHLDSILKFRIDTDSTDDTPGPPGLLLGGMGYEYLYNGPGELDATKTTENILINEGEVPTLTAFPSTSAALTVEISDSGDADKAIRITGKDDSSNEIHEGDGTPGERIVLVNPSTTSSNTFSDIYGIQKPTTQGRVTIKHGSTTLSVLQPSDTAPVYRRYKVAHQDAATVQAYCKRRYVPVADEEDYIVPGSLSALENGLRALNYERRGDPENKSYRYWATAFDSLSGDQTEYRGGEQVIPSMNPWGLGVERIQHTI